MSSERGFLARAVELAAANIAEGGGPFAAIIVKDGKIIAEGTNCVTNLSSCILHAEIVAIHKACRALGTWDLSGCEIYTSCYPCPMCAGAILWAHIEKVFYAATTLEARDYAGFDDLDFYKQIKNLDAKQIKLDNYLKPFKIWFKKKNKKLY